MRVGQPHRRQLDIDYAAEQKDRSISGFSNCQTAESRTLLATFSGVFKSPVQPLRRASDGSTLACWSQDGVYFCDTSTGAVTKTYENTSIPRLSPDFSLCAEPHHCCATRLWQTENGNTICVLVSLNQGRGIAISPEGHYRASTRAGREIVYVVQTAEGQQTLSPDEFAEKYNWTNDPDKVRLPDASEGD